jgi:hypothetical protein
MIALEIVLLSVIFGGSSQIAAVYESGCHQTINTASRSPLEHRQTFSPS